MNSKDKKASMVSLETILSKNGIFRKTHYQIPSFNKSGGGKKFVLYGITSDGMNSQQNFDRVVTCLENKNILFEKTGTKDNSCVVIASSIPSLIDSMKESGITPTENQSEASGQSSSDTAFQNFVNDNDEMNQEIKNQELSKIINLHRDMGILGTLNREQEYSKINLFHFNYFDESETNRTLEFFKPLGCVSIRTGKRCNLEFDLTKLSESKIMELDSFEMLDISNFDEVQKIEVLTWIVKKVFRESASVRSNTQIPYTTQRIELAARNFESNVAFLKKIGFCFFTEYVNTTKKSIFVSLNEDFDHFLKTNTSKETIFINIISAYKPGVAKPKKMAENKKKNAHPHDVIKSRIAVWASRNNVPSDEKFKIHERTPDFEILKFNNVELFEYVKNMIQKTNTNLKIADVSKHLMVVSEKKKQIKLSKRWDYPLDSTQPALVASGTKTENVKIAPTKITKQNVRKTNVLDGDQILNFLNNLKKRGYGIVSLENPISVTEVVVDSRMGELSFSQEKIKSFKSTLTEVSAKELFGLE